VGHGDLRPVVRPTRRFDSNTLTPPEAIHWRSSAQKLEFGGGAATDGEVAVSFKLYLADPELVKTILDAMAKSGETNTAKWMTASNKE